MGCQWWCLRVFHDPHNGSLIYRAVLRTNTRAIEYSRRFYVTWSFLCAMLQQVGTTTVRLSEHVWNTSVKQLNLNCETNDGIVYWEVAGFKTRAFSAVTKVNVSWGWSVFTTWVCWLPEFWDASAIFECYFFHSGSVEVFQFDQIFSWNVIAIKCVAVLSLFRIWCVMLCFEMSIREDEFSLQQKLNLLANDLILYPFLLFHFPFWLEL